MSNQNPYHASDCKDVANPRPFTIRDMPPSAKVAMVAGAVFQVAAVVAISLMPTPPTQWHRTVTFVWIIGPFVGCYLVSGLLTQRHLQKSHTTCGDKREHDAPASCK